MMISRLSFKKLMLHGFQFNLHATVLETGTMKVNEIEI